MKKVFSVFGIAVFCVIMAMPVFGAMEGDTKDIPSCIHCGMNRDMFAHSRMLIDYSDGSKAGLCSLHCVAVDLALNLDKTPTMIQVGDYNTKALIDAEKAYWLIGGTKPGVMTKNAKWAFADQADAEKFRKENGGRIGNFDDALQAAYTDLADDTQMIRDKRSKKRQMKMEHKH